MPFYGESASVEANHNPMLASVLIRPFMLKMIPPSIPLSHASMPSNSMSFVTILITSLLLKSSDGLSTFIAMMLSTIPRNLETRTPILAQPRSRSHPSTTRPRPIVSKSMAPEKRRSVYALKAVEEVNITLYLPGDGWRVWVCGGLLTSQVPDEHLGRRDHGEIRHE